MIVVSNTSFWLYVGFGFLPVLISIPVLQSRVRTVNYTYGSNYTTTYHQLFGVPQLVTVPREELNYRKLYNILLDHMR